MSDAKPIEEPPLTRIQSVDGAIYYVRIHKPKPIIPVYVPSPEPVRRAPAAARPALPAASQL